MEPMRRPGDIPTGYERGIIEESALLSERYPVAASFPTWMTQTRGQLTEQGFKLDVMAYLATSAGGLARDNDLAPNTLLQNMCITKSLDHIEKDDFVQACMTRLEHGAYLAAIFVRHEGPGFWIQPARFHTPQPLRPVFY